MNMQLQEFIAHARKKGMDHQTIRMLLLSSGWKEKDIAEALTEQTLDMPIPAPPDTGGAREAFFHLLTFVGLYTWVISVAILFYDYINRLFPDRAFEEYYSTDGNLSAIRWSIAAIIVSFPLFYFLSRFLLKEMRQAPERAWSGIRRWLTYLTLFVAAGALMSDVITLVFFLLDGQITIRFVLKVLVIVLLAGGTFSYYFLSLRTHPSDPRSATIHRTYGWLAIAVVAIAIVWGIAIAGSPGTSRAKHFDEQRLADFRAIQSEISNITLDKTRYEPIPSRQLLHPLPTTLQEVQEKALTQKLDSIDPETQEPYEYALTGESTYQLCATFNEPRDERYDIAWNHPAGKHCFALDVLDPNF